VCVCVSVCVKEEVQDQRPKNRRPKDNVPTKKDSKSHAPPYPLTHLPMHLPLRLGVPKLHHETV
jgi:hypothetical protein